eukprot:CAMPEP_0115271024 /NCGR_PEP_ID=MMETSP0270-20121206/53877_1 /TAXON_ID=71861 /ORGANISM="Scrippsiella trochoidea, Strain CCMP3099" /LENGTH=131 /DNA_ID=CAMNT_0002687353 /DNA_START=76 /DNA_END=471 /DNA_ORIENTATION=-
MARRWRSRSAIAPVAATLLVLGVVCQLPGAFLPTAPASARASRELVEQHLDVSQGATAAAMAAWAAGSAPVLAVVEEEEDGFDVRILAVLFLPALAVAWALFNVWRVALRQTVRIGEGLSGSSKLGLNADD